MSKDIAFYMDQVQDIFESVCVKKNKKKTKTCGISVQTESV